MNILIIDNSKAFTGALKCALSEAALLSGQHQFSFLLPTGSLALEAVRSAGFKVFELPMLEIRKSGFTLIKYPFSLTANTFKLRSIIRQEKIDCLQMNDFYNLLGASQKWLGYKGKLLTWVRFLPRVMPTPLRKLWTGIAQRNADKIIAVSRAVLKELPTHPQTVCIYDPVHLSENHPPKKLRNDMLVQCLYLGNYIPGKGQDAALAAFVGAYKVNQNLRLHFAGGDMGLQKNLDFKAALQQQVSALKLEPVITFSGFATDVEATIKNADIVLNFSEAESFSMTCLETAFYGTPLIATKCGGPEEIIEDGITGMLLPVGDVEGFKNALLKLAGDEKLRQKFSENSAAYVRDKFSTSRYVSEMTHMLNSL